MKNFFFSIAAVCSVFAAQAQTAPDFTATDCSGNSYNLYTELNAGKVVVLTWVMPCMGCVAGGNAAQSAVQSFDASNPGQVVFWMIDDFGDTPCASLASWATSNGISKPTVFSNSGNVIDENDFGGTGMPHVVVVSPDKTILYNQKNGNTDDEIGITNAINQGISTLSVAQMDAKLIGITPNPVSSDVKIVYGKSIQSVNVVAANGQVVLHQQYGAGIMNPTLDVSKLATGSYQVVITDSEGKRGVQQIIKQ